MALSKKEGRRIARTLATLRREEHRGGTTTNPTRARLNVRAEVARDALLAYLLDAKIHDQDAGADYAWELDRSSPVATDNAPAPDAAQ